MDNGLYFKLIKPDESLSDFVESFWLLHNPSDSAREMIVLPDGRVELTFSQSETMHFHITRSGIETQPERVLLAAKTLTFAISFKLLATEYIFQNNISDLLDNAELLPDNFWDFGVNDLTDFELFCDKATQKIRCLLPKEMNQKKRRLFDLIYSSKGSLTVKELSENLYWSSRQMNRYFNQQFGLSVKTYCNILRFRASLEHLAQGKLFPELDYADQSHFIKEIKRFSGVIPKDLLKNKNDRFIQFSALASK